MYSEKVNEIIHRERKILDSIANQWAKGFITEANNVKEVNMEDFEYVDMSSNIDPMDYNDMRFCGTTETQL